MGEMRSAYKILVGETEGKRPFKRCGHKWKDCSKWFLVKCGLSVCIGLIWLRVGTSGGLL
jgi:hypothetical protein